MTISCTAVASQKTRRDKLILALNQLGITPQVHGETVVIDWKGQDPCMLNNLTNLVESFPQHSVYYSTSAK